MGGQAMDNKGKLPNILRETTRGTLLRKITLQGWSIKPQGQWSIIWQWESVQILYLGSNLVWENGLGLGDVWEFCI